MNGQSPNNDHDDVQLLLPWFVNKTLADSERARVEHHVANCAECQENIGLFTAMRAAVTKTTAIPIPPPPRVDELLESIAASNPLKSLYQSRLRLKGAVALGFVILVVGLLLTNNEDILDSPQRFETVMASNPIVLMDYVLSIHFEPDISSTERERLLQDIEAREIAGGNDLDDYRVVVQLPATSIEELALYTSDLAARPNVKSVSVIALQFPMR